jgi:hypothetical protein
MRSTGKSRAIRNAFFRLGLHTTPKVVVHALGEQGVQFDAELFRQVRIDLVRETTAAFIPSSRVPLPAVRRRPQGFQRRRSKS